MFTNIVSASHNPLPTFNMNIHLSIFTVINQIIKESIKDASMFSGINFSDNEKKDKFYVMKFSAHSNTFKQEILM